MYFSGCYGNGNYFRHYARESIVTFLLPTDIYDNDGKPEKRVRLRILMSSFLNPNRKPELRMKRPTSTSATRPLFSPPDAIREEREELLSEALHFFRSEGFRARYGIGL